MSQTLQSTSYAGAGEHLFLSEELSDFVILVHNGEENWRFPVHRLVLASQSHVFLRNLESEFSEKINKEIHIKDIKPKIMELLLSYMYCGRVSLENWLDSLDLLQAAHKYDIKPLVNYCARFLETVLTIQNVCYIYNAACLYSLLTLKEKCLKLILDAGFKILKSKAFETLTKDAVMEIIINSDLNRDSELAVFEALKRWAPMQCCRMGRELTDSNTLEELMPFLEHMCFDDMSDTEKSKLPPSVLNCVKPNNLNRIKHCIPESILQFSQRFQLVHDLQDTEIVGDNLPCIRFSIDSAQCIVGFSFEVLVNELPISFLVTLTNECMASTVVINEKLILVTGLEGVEINDRILYKADLILRKPYFLEAKAVYKLSLIDRSQTGYCPKTKVVVQTLLTSKGHANLSVHIEHCWGITGIVIV